MPPRTSNLVSNNIFNLTSLLHNLPTVYRPSAFTKCSACLFSTTAPQEARKKHHQIRKRVDPYRVAQARQRKAANLVRREVLQKERKAAMGDPVRSKPTPFVESLRPRAPVEAFRQSYLNYFIKSEDMQKSLDYSKWLIEPMNSEDKPKDPEVERLTKEEYENNHKNATKALAAIAALENGNGKDRTRVHFARCVEEFGRHNTDKHLRPKPASKQTSSSIAATDGDSVVGLEIPKRAGPDTGSSEVQIAILTTKINVLADQVHNKDKQNKRNMRLLVHKRQKLLDYLRRKERGGPRWQNLVEKLGINDAMWKGEIAL